LDPEEPTSGAGNVLVRITRTVTARLSPTAPDGPIGRWVHHRFGSPAGRRARLAAGLGLID
jgi:hypothetical protein